MRPPDSLLYENEQVFYLHFARALDYPANRLPRPSLPIGPSETCGVPSGTVVLAPGCKPGVMATKRWPYFTELAVSFSDVVVVGTPTVMLFGPTPHDPLGPMPPNVKVLRAGLPCEPCWFRDRFRACGRKIECLSTLHVEAVIREVSACLS